MAIIASTLSKRSESIRSESPRGGTIHSRDSFSCKLKFFSICTGNHGRILDPLRGPHHSKTSRRARFDPHPKERGKENNYEERRRAGPESGGKSPLRLFVPSCPPSTTDGPLRNRLMNLKWPPVFRRVPEKQPGLKTRATAKFRTTPVHKNANLIVGFARDKPPVCAPLRSALPPLLFSFPSRSFFSTTRHYAPCFSPGLPNRPAKFAFNDPGWRHRHVKI